MILTDFTNRVRYRLFNINLGTKTIVDPIGWADDSKEYARNGEYYGIVSNFSNNLIFVKNGADFINYCLFTYGINAEIRLTREELDPQTDIWTVVYTGFLDLSTWNFENRQVHIKFNSGGIEKLLKARESEQVEIDRPQSIDGMDITPIPEISTLIRTQNLPLVSNWKSKVDTPDNKSYLYEETRDGVTGSMTCGIPFPTEENPLTEAESILYGSFIKQRGHSTGVTVGGVGQMFYNNSTKERALHVEINLSSIFHSSQSGVDWANFEVLLVLYKDGATYNVKQKFSLFELSDKNKIATFNGKPLTITNYVKDITLLTGESLALVCETRYDLRKYFPKKTSKLETYIDKVAGSIYVSETLTGTNTFSQAYLYRDLMHQLCKITTNDNNTFKSNYLSNSLFGVTHGFFIRNFAKLPLTTGENVNQFKPLTTSFKDAFQSLDSILPLGMGIETVNNKETIVIEPIDYFFNRNVTIDLPNQVSNLKRAVAVEFYYSNLLFGSEADFEYEEVSGLDEFNTKNSRTTIISRVKKSYEKLAKYRFDGTGKELCRVQQVTIDSTKDTKYDTNIWVLDLKKSADNVTYEEKRWQDYYATKPQGIYSPDSSTGFYFTPNNCLKRHGKVISVGLEQNPNDFIFFSASDGNKQLELDGEKVSDPILNSSLDKKLFTPQWITFEHKVDFNTMRKLQGSTIINGTEVKNFYGLVQFINDAGNIEKGFLFSVKPEGAGEWKLLKL
jgi:hypothetical protein